MLDLTVKNPRPGTFTNRHIMVDVELNGRFISTYECNPFYRMDPEGEIFNRIADVISRSDPEYDTGTAAGLFKIYCGMERGKDLYDNTVKSFMDIILKTLKDGILDLIDLKDVERCLFNDAGCFESGSGFGDFCLNLDYDPGSIKALKDYESCKEIYLRLAQTVGPEKLREGIEYYRENRDPPVLSFTGYSGKESVRGPGEIPGKKTGGKTVYPDNTFTGRILG